MDKCSCFQYAGDNPQCPVHGNQPKMLATVNFVQRTSVNRGESFYYHRFMFLDWRTVRLGTTCSDCGVKIEPGGQAAFYTFDRFCGNCVALMTMSEALERSSARNADIVTVARLRGEKYGVFSAKEIRHVVTVAQAG